MKIDRAVTLVGGGRLGSGLSNAYDSNVYLLHDDEGCWLIDTGSGLEQGKLIDRIRAAASGMPIKGALLTHAHADHAGGAAGIAELGIAVQAGPRTCELVRTPDHDALGLTSAIRAGTYPSDFTFPSCPATAIDGPAIPGAPDALIAVATPGHSSDHTSYLYAYGSRTYAFTGDLVFSRGRVAVLGTHDTDVASLHASLQRLHELSPDVLLPGHGSPVLSDARWHLAQALREFDLGRLPPNLV